MRSMLAFGVMAVLFVSPMFVGNVQAADKAKKDAAPAGTEFSGMGKVSAVKADVDKFQSAKFTTPDGKVYNITLDEKGNGVVKQYEGISVFLNGVVTEKDKENWLTVKSVGEKKKPKKK